MFLDLGPIYALPLVLILVTMARVHNDWGDYAGDLSWELGRGKSVLQNSIGFETGAFATKMAEKNG